MKKIIIALFCLSLWSCEKNQHEHQDPTHNFTVKRLIILNDNNEVLMGKESSYWFTPSLIYNQQQFVRESLDSLANSYGIEITSPELRGYFSYKYDYHPFSTLRAYYVARYVKGELKTPTNFEEVKWIPMSEAIEKAPVISMNEITTQILNFPNTVWGGSFLISRSEDQHPSKMVEEFYPLLKIE